MKANITAYASELSNSIQAASAKFLAARLYVPKFTVDVIGDIWRDLRTSLRREADSVTCSAATIREIIADGVITPAEQAKLELVGVDLADTGDRLKAAGRGNA